MPLTSSDKLNAKANELEAIYKDALERLAGIQADERRIITNHLEKLKEKRLAELREIMTGRKTQD